MVMSAHSENEHQGVDNMKQSTTDINSSMYVYFSDMFFCIHTYVFHKIHLICCTT